MGVIISIANKKGGVGKSTIATNLACFFSSSGKSVVLIDADEQKSSMYFQELRPDTAKQFQTVSITTRTILREAEKFNADYVIIDVPAKDSPVSRAAIAAADRVIVPVQPSQYDILASEDTFRLLDEVAAQKQNFKFAVIQNMVLSNPKVKITGEVSEVLKDMAKEFGLHLFNSVLYMRIAYKDSAEKGLSVAEMKGEKYTKAEEEFNSFYKEVLKWL
ncbi:MAG TPA: AAA family ATPase [bacterium]|jgi:chromosome partitioning protein|nr:AAA family ATPase [bacterium]HOG44813.1 AAA family ATPase [bacterium]HPM48162.1 AAA family ATPase [bacterium]HQI05370.1 AAA family ATPase [bacterium]HQM84964.1 AAA family ATPase [bacterium]